MNQQSIESLYFYLDGTSERLQRELEFTYLEGFCEAAKNLLEGEILQDLEPSARETLQGLLETVVTKSFHPEEIRKATQLSLLRGIQSDGLNLSAITPDTVGILIAYLLDKLMPKRRVKILDPVAKTGNLLFTVRNHVNRDAVVIGIERDPLFYEILKAMYGLLDIPEEAYCQESLSFFGGEADAIVADFEQSMPGDETYFPYKAILHHHQNLAQGGLFAAVIFDEFFDRADSPEFRKLLTDKYQVVGLLSLPDTLFKRIGKSILILQKQGPDVRRIERALAVKIPDFQDEASSKRTISQIDRWIEENIIEGVSQ
jgi:site-specific DNA-methyltransferase (adenine-specific)